ncbi:hypothetical protein DICPUDRAFT_38826 [Dictyostelium purpureum]|uniref:Glutamine amidotransferase type-2 domain-containing protein n=1 Tax=Dictyostelium purpureum TaxID=5786 RepID=F0ZVC5_DICPU|nr:uncharacterized protein DICPUDRAFT_38826 [Dictyostelium purpureum]EGC32110.1 hypothetical protein DICPUDRAFT_38826 [Dictyostelium purpureum]|eukprot:XP_003291360.1 hypothetical protein DICPUDRAFT_38826 [Dictyostelium purpureum]
MCGISGWVNWSNLDLLKEIDTIQKMNQAVFHRGPEEGGFFTCSDALFGHRRLCVIDAAGGKQPMEYKKGDKSIVLCFNGELYNFQDLRKELEQLGHTFKSHSDTEVILMSYVEWGEECVKRLNGMFAVAIFDQEKERLFFARDHLGIKPLFYCIRGDSILFGSEIKVLLSNSKLVQPLVDKDGVAQLFYLGAFRTPETGCVFKDINELGAGKTITFNKSGGSFTTSGEKEYWNLKCAPHTDDLKATEKKLRHLIEAALSRQLVSDVPITFLLSGGLASSALVSLATSLAKSDSLPEQSPINQKSVLKTFSCEFEGDEKEYKEEIAGPKKPWMEKVVDNVQSEHTSTQCSVDQLLDNLLSPMRARDLPSFSKWETPLRLMLKKVKEHGVVLISDEGSDEIFSGYDWFKKEEALKMERLPWIGQCYAHFNKYLNSKVLNSVDYIKYGENIYKKAIERIPMLEGEDEAQQKQRIQSWLFIKYFLIYMLEREDRVSMSQSLEVRVPYCDFNLVEYCWNIPDNIKSVGDIEKGILRRSMISQLPRDILNHQKDRYPLSVQDTNYFIGICNILQIILLDSNSPILMFIKCEPINEIIENKNKQLYQTHENQVVIEHLIQVNNWILEYKVKFV